MNDFTIESVFMVECFISTLFYNMLLQESVVFLACPAVLRISMTQKKPIKITRVQPIVVSRFTRRNMDLMQKVYMNLFHLLATHFAQSVFFLLLILGILGFLGYMLSKGGARAMLLHHYDISTRQTQNLEFKKLSTSC